MAAPISIGIGRAGVTATESELHARQALEMALGRGGDQVAIYQQDVLKEKRAGRFTFAFIKTKFLPFEFRNNFSTDWF